MGVDVLASILSALASLLAEGLAATDLKDNFIRAARHALGLLPIEVGHP
jgi:hypothetical protein